MTLVQIPTKLEVISGQIARKSRGLRREMLRKQHFCVSRSVVTFTTCKGVNSNKCKSYFQDQKRNIIEIPVEVCYYHFGTTRMVGG